jgi:hypothetical protein
MWRFGWLPAIVSQPISQTVNQGQNSSFIVQTGPGLLNYQWQFNGVNISGATSNIYVVTNVQPINAGYYSVSITNLGGAVVSSNAVLTVNAGPAITVQPQSLVLGQDSDAVFSVLATGSPAPVYQWYANGTNLIGGATNNIFTVTNAQPAAAGFYSVVISNSVSQVLSSNAVLVIVPLSPPVLGAIAFLADGLHLRGSGSPGRVGLRVSTNLVNWTDLTNFYTPSKEFEFVDPQTNLSERFYRVWLQ